MTDTDPRTPLPFTGRLTDDLRGRQSVRATFKLSARAIDALSIVAVHLGIKQKSLFDHLIEDLEILETIARNVKRKEFDTLNRVQKTFVLSRRTLACLEQTSRRYNAPRDALVEYSIQRLLPLIRAEREKHRLRKEFAAAFARHLRQGEALLQQACQGLGEDDQLVGHMANLVRYSRQAHEQISSYLEKGAIIEGF